MNNDTINPVVTATCTKCGVEKPLTEEFFRRDKSKKIGFRRDCRVCEHNRYKDYYAANAEQLCEKHRRFRAENLAMMREYDKCWREVNPDKTRDKQARWRQANPDKTRENFKHWKNENPDKAREGNTRWRRANPDKEKAKYHRRRARKQGLPDSFTSHDWRNALEYFEHRCAVCGRPAGLWHTLAADHWIPLRSPNCPGTVPSNIVPLCHGDGGCNNSKGDRDPQEWIKHAFSKRKAKTILERIEAYFKALPEAQRST